MASAPATQTHMDTNSTTTFESILNSSEIQTTHRFDLKIVRDAFVNCIQPDNTLLLREYIRAYEELCV